MPKDRKKTYSDHQAQAARDKKLQQSKDAPKKKSAQDENEIAAPIVKDATGR
jgi:hypothetical protein